MVDRRLASDVERRDRDRSGDPDRIPLRGYDASRLRVTSKSWRYEASGRRPTRASWKGPATPKIVGQARRAVTGFAATAGISAIRLDDIRLCVSEAVATAVMHAFRDGQADGTVNISAEFSPAALTVVVTDDGIGLPPRSDSPALGLGLAIIQSLADSMSAVPLARGGSRRSINFNLVHPRPPTT